MVNAAEYRVCEANGSLNHSRPKDGGVSIGFSATSFSADGASQNMNLEKDALLSTFLTNYAYWNNETNFLSTDNFDNENFKKIVAMGESVVPDIYELIKESPNPIVHALDQIYPGVVDYKGLVSLQDVCDAWVAILPLMGKV